MFCFRCQFKNKKTKTNSQTVQTSTAFFSSLFFFFPLLTLMNLGFRFAFFPPRSLFLFFLGYYFYFLLFFFDTHTSRCFWGILQLHLQDFTIMLDSCSILGVLPMQQRMVRGSKSWDTQHGEAEASGFMVLYKLSTQKEKGNKRLRWIPLPA